MRINMRINFNSALFSLCNDAFPRVSHKELLFLKVIGTKVS